MIYTCNDCGCFFTDEEAGTAKVDQEAEYGVGGDFTDHHFKEIMVCPYCHSDDIEEYEPSDEEICEMLNGR